VSVEENKAIIRRLEAALNAGQANAGLDVWADNLVFNGQPISPQTIAQLRAPLWAAVPDVSWTMEQLVAEGDWVAVRSTMRGTHTGDFAHPTFGSAPASGMAIDMTYMDHYRIADGRIAEAWEVRDALALLQQLSVIPTPGQPPA
jgi:predicted ester cyclase